MIPTNTRNQGRRAGFLGSLLMMLTLLIAGSCSSDNSQTLPALLATVPADAGGAVAIQIEEILKKTDCKFTSEGVKLSEPVQKMVSSLTTPDEKTKAALLIEGKGGVDLSSVVLFSASRPYLTGLLEDPEAFRNCVEKTAGVTFETDGEAGTASCYAYVGNQFWISLAGTPVLEDLKRYHKLSENQSILSRKGIERLQEGKGEVTGLVDLQSALSGTGTANRLPVAMATIFDSPSQILIEGKMKSKEMQLTASILDNKGKLSRFLLPTPRIETSEIKKLKGKANWVGAVAISEEMLKKIASLLGPFGANLLGPDSPWMQIQGTCVVADGTGAGPEVLFPTKSTPSPALISQIGEVFGSAPSVDGNSLWINRDAAMEGTLDCASLADHFKGAVAGAVIDLGSLSKAGKAKNGNETIEVMLVPEGNSLAIRLILPLDPEELASAIDSML